MARISKGKFRYLRDLFGYSDFVLCENLKTGLLTGYHRGKMYTNMYPKGPVGMDDLAVIPGQTQTLTLSFHHEV